MQINSIKKIIKESSEKKHVNNFKIFLKKKKKVKKDTRKM